MKATSILELTTVLVTHGLIFYQMSQNPKLSYDPVVIGFMVTNYMLLTLLQICLPFKNSGSCRHEDPGLWCCLVLPVAVLLVNVHSVGFVLLLVSVSMFQYVLFREELFSRVTLVVILSLVAAYTVLQAVYLHTFIDIKWRYPLLYFYLIHNLPEWFPRSFTFGEASLISQIYFSVLFYFFIQPRAALEPLDSIAGIAFVGLTIAVVIMYQFSDTRLPTLGILVAIILAGAFVLPALFFFVGMASIWPVVSDLLVSRTALLLLAWWIICTVGSILLVCFYGYQTTKPHTNGDKQKHVTAENDSYEKVSDAKIDDMNSQTKVTNIKKTTEKIKKENKKTSKTDESLKHSQTLSHDIIAQSDLQKDQSCDPATESHDQTVKSSIKREDSELNRKDTSVLPTNGKNVSTITRKYFHLAILCVYVPGLIYRPDLLYLASIVATGVLVLIEAIRVLNIPPFGAALKPYLQVFLDQQDKGDLILTPIYLLIGCSLPLWIANQNTGDACSLVYYSGLISVGVGDSAASIFGRKFGRHKWPDSKKTLEGTFAAVVCQLVAIKALEYLEVPGASITVVTTLAVILVSCLEAFTSQIDNLVVPVLACMLFAAVDLENVRPELMHN